MAKYKVVKEVKAATLSTNGSVSVIVPTGTILDGIEKTKTIKQGEYTNVLLFTYNGVELYMPLIYNGVTYIEPMTKAAEISPKEKGVAETCLVGAPLGGCFLTPKKLAIGVIVIIGVIVLFKYFKK
jgi:hypothetical protein